MKWRTEFNEGIGKFRNAEFIISTDDSTFGRRKQTHEFPLRDKPYIEDLGAGTREFSIDVFVIGSDYFADRDKLIAALDEKGPGVLEHPYFGTVTVQVLGKPRVRQTTREGGKASFTINFIRVPDEPEELVEVDNLSGLVGAVLEFQEAATNAFADVFDTLNQAQQFVDEVQSEIESALQTIEDVVDGITGPITALIRAPFNLGSAIMGTFNNVKNSLKDPFRALNLYSGLFDSGSSSPQIPQTTSNRIQQIDNTAAMHQLVQQAAISEACLLTTTIDFASISDAIVVRDKLLAAIDAQIEEPAVQSSTIVISNTVYDALQQLRSTLVEYIRVEAAKLPRVTYFENKASLPALVLAHRIHQDANRDAEIISRNHVHHPGFVTGGQELEVLIHV